MPEDEILHNYRCENLISYNELKVSNVQLCDTHSNKCALKVESRWKDITCVSLLCKRSTALDMRQRMKFSAWFE
jgi:hypothetical protein